MSENQYDVMIVGNGPAGITAALYGQRLGLKTIVFGDIPGGNLYMIEKLMNFPGFMGGVPGTQFGVTAQQQAQEEGALFTMSRLEHLSQRKDAFQAEDANGLEYEAQAAILATGRVPKRLSVPKAGMKGIHFCSICDGPLYRGHDATLAVIGSDNAAGQHALSLARIARRVFLIFRSHDMKMDAAHRNLIAKQENITVEAKTEVAGFKGLDLLEGLEIKRSTGEGRVIPVDGVFMAIGWRANTSMLDFSVNTDAEGYVRTDAKLMTSVPGLFAAGDVRDTDMWQVLTACADGARAAKYVAEYLEEK
jgi:thioredoxin reductase (NADPH)